MRSRLRQWSRLTELEGEDDGQERFAEDGEDATAGADDDRGVDTGADAEADVDKDADEDLQGFQALQK